MSHTSCGSLSRPWVFSTSSASRLSLAALLLVRGPEAEDPSRFAIFLLSEMRRPGSRHSIAKRVVLLVSRLPFSRLGGRLARCCRSTALRGCRKAVRVFGGNWIQEILVAVNGSLYYKMVVGGSKQSKLFESWPGVESIHTRAAIFDRPLEHIQFPCFSCTGTSPLIPRAALAPQPPQYLQLTSPSCTRACPFIPGAALALEPL